MRCAMPARPQCSGGRRPDQDPTMTAKAHLQLLITSFLWVTSINAAPHFTKPFMPLVFRPSGIRPAVLAPYKSQQYHTQEHPSPITETIYVIIQDDNTQGVPTREQYGSYSSTYHAKPFQGPSFTPDPQRRYQTPAETDSSPIITVEVIEVDPEVSLGFNSQPGGSHRLHENLSASSHEQGDQGGDYSYPVYGIGNSAEQPRPHEASRPYNPPADADAQLENNPPIDIRSGFPAVPRTA